MGSNEFDQHAAKKVRDMNDQPILVTTEIEDNAVVANEIDGRTELAFDVVRVSPPRLSNYRVPCARRTFRLLVPPPEPLERPAGDHLHRVKYSMSPNWRQGRLALMGHPPQTRPPSTGCAGPAA